MKNNSFSGIAKNSPVAVGCIGGSGSRLISQILLSIGFYMGDCRNKAEDNLWYTLLFRKKHITQIPPQIIEELIDIFVQKMLFGGGFTKKQIHIIQSTATEEHTIPPNLIEKSTASIFQKHAPTNVDAHWGWKEPTTHLLLPTLMNYIPNLKYIYIARNGLDMAFSKNQNQLSLWGHLFLGKACQVTPYYSLKYTRIVYEKIIKHRQMLADRVFIINFDQLCHSPDKTLLELFDFLKVQPTSSQFMDIKNLIKPPKSIGRFKQFDLSIFDKSDIDFLDLHGFDTTP